VQKQFLFVVFFHIVYLLFLWYKYGFDFWGENLQFLEKKNVFCFFEKFDHTFNHTKTILDHTVDMDYNKYRLQQIQIIINTKIDTKIDTDHNK